MAMAAVASSPPESSSNPSSSSTSSAKHGEEEGNHQGGGKDHHHHQQQQQQQQQHQKVSEASSPKLPLDESAQEAGKSEAENHRGHDGHHHEEAAGQKKEKPSFLLPPLHRPGPGATTTTMDVMNTLPPASNQIKRQRSWPGPITPAPITSSRLPPRHSCQQQQHSDQSLPPLAAPSCKAQAKTGGPKHEQATGNHPVARHGHELSPAMSLPANRESSSSSSSSWRRVTTTGRGPNGRTIFGFMYITTSHQHVPQVWLVCNCHGKHMSPLEFVEHSGSSDLSNPERNIVVNSLPFFPQVATTPV